VVAGMAVGNLVGNFVAILIAGMKMLVGIEAESFEEAAIRQIDGNFAGNQIVVG